MRAAAHSSEMLPASAKLPPPGVGAVSPQLQQPDDEQNARADTPLLNPEGQPSSASPSQSRMAGSPLDARGVIGLDGH